jgi:hypothetical protein
MINAREPFQRAFELRSYVENMQASSDEVYTAAYENAARDAATQIEPLVGRCLVDNWKATGMGDTGTMQSNLAKPKVFAKVKGGSISLSMYMNPSATGYKRKDGTTSAFTVAGALNFGAVRMSQSRMQSVDPVTGAIGISGKGTNMRIQLGASAKATIKKMAMEGKASKRAMSSLARGIVVRKGHNAGTTIRSGYDVGKVDFAKQTKKMGVSAYFSSGVVVIPPKEFFFLTTRQQSVIGTEFLKFLILNLKMGKG